jgi:hypothetical protein
MIIFDLDGTLALCEHRRHFVDPIKAGYEFSSIGYDPITRDPVIDLKPAWRKVGNPDKLWKPNWDAFYEACDKDLPNVPICNIFNLIIESPFDTEVQIWSGRSESVRIKTHAWLFAKLSFEPCRDTGKVARRGCCSGKNR